MNNEEPRLRYIDNECFISVKTTSKERALRLLEITEQDCIIIDAGPADLQKYHARFRDFHVWMRGDQ